MPVDVRTVAAAGALAGAAASVAYTIAAAVRVRRFGTRLRETSTQRTSFSPPITVLRPLHGDEPGLYDHLVSTCRQSYARYQVIFGAADKNDPALAVARAVQQDVPECDVRIVGGEAKPARNPKIGNLQSMLPYAKYDTIVIADSDMTVPPQWLQAVAMPFARHDVGAVTCLYGAAPDGKPVSEIAAMFVNEQFSPSVLVAMLLEPLSYCFGATMAVTANVLERIGGLETLADHLADDYRLGSLVRSAGYRVELAQVLPHTSVARCDLRSLLAREVRWARTIRGTRPAGYAGSILENVLVWSALAASLSRSLPISLATLAVAFAARFALHTEASRTFAPTAAGSVWLIPVRDALSAGVWCAGLLGRRVGWRGAELRVEADGRTISGPSSV